ncbi:MAG: efflux RND transporter periplasmic adaptor subunit [Gemmatimonadales bacterium]|nr:efflux RND transporter periplasmic adaptor subunit [Gemmatimonadales bacterium]MDZ4389915.1 efflux RND transporter periplasmic adaptor subunit [Gemmatimonadales bacterium]
MYRHAGITPFRSLFVALFLTLAAAACNQGAAPAEEDVEAQAVDSSEAGVVSVDSATMASVGIRVAAVTSAPSGGLAVTGTITYDANLVSHIGSRTAGRVVDLRADLGDAVKSGQVLAVLESPEVGQVRSEEREAEELLAIAQENFDREQRLETQGISSRKELLDAEADLRRTEAALRSARERLRVLGAGHGNGGEFGLTAPFAGVVVERQVTRGEMADPKDQLFVIADLSRVWVLLNVFERDLATVRVGQPVQVTTSAWPGREFAGRIVYLGAVLDTATRTIQARIEVPNRDGALRPGMFATARISASGAGPTMPVVPRDAVQEIEGETVVFVPNDHPGEFRAQAIVVGAPVGADMVSISAGLAIGDMIVVSGAFMLRSELAKGEIGEHGH